MLCAECGTEFSSRFKKAKFCKPLCKQRWFNRNTPKTQIAVTCPICEKIRWVQRKTQRDSTQRQCSSCATDAMCGDQSPVWKGGHRHWSPGRLGRDKDGLSWKTQRRLAWERDNYTCQECGKHKDGWKPDVHHVSPFRVSQSHALENLKCYCRKCHLKEEAKVQEQWGGQTFTSTRPRTGSYCTGCDHRIQGKPYTHIPGESLCQLCKQARLVPIAQSLRTEGKSIVQIGKTLGISPMSASYYARGVLSWKMTHPRPAGEMVERGP